MTSRTVYLKPPLLSPSHIKDRISCIRSHRERLFRVETELQSNKLICHNYGQGGAGWTFLFGCVKESIRQFEHAVSENLAFINKPICVVGAGCYGLLTAILLAQKGYSVHIIAKEISNVPSYAAAGFFFPRSRKCSTPTEIDIFLSLGMESYQEYLHIAAGKHPFISKGATLLPAYYDLDIDPGFAPYIAHGLIDPPEKVIINFGNGNMYESMEYKTIFMNTLLLMQELHRVIKELNILIIQKEVMSFDELPESIIFNCTGLGAKNLTNDLRIVFVQGHLITLQNQHNISSLQYMINVKVTMKDPQGKPRDELIYFAPKGHGILGITFLRGQNNPQANIHEFERLLERAQMFFGKVVE